MLRQSGLVGIVLVLLIVGFAATQQGKYQAGGVEVHSSNDIVALTSSTNTVDAGNYDTLESPRGTDYQVPAGTTFVVTLLTASGTGDIGYGDDAVSDSASPPTNAVTVCTFIGSGEVWCPIPSDKFPFVRVDTAGAVSAVGVER